MQCNVIQGSEQRELVMLQLKMLNISSCIAQALLLCAKYCLPPLHNCWVIAAFCRLAREKLIGARHINLNATLDFYALFSHLSPNQTAIRDYILLPLIPFLCFLFLSVFFSQLQFTSFFLVLRDCCNLITT